MAINKIFFKPTSGKIVLAVLLLIPIYFLITFLLRACMPLKLPNLGNPNNNKPVEYGEPSCGFISSILIFLGDMPFFFFLVTFPLAYLFSCTIVALYKEY
jgi:hypothetical protein